MYHIFLITNAFFILSLLSCWLHSEKGFKWGFLGPVCAIFSVSDDIKASLILS